MRFFFDEKWTIAIGWTRSANHFFIPLFLVSVLIFPVNNRKGSFAWLEKPGSWISGMFLDAPWITKLSLAAMHNKKKFSEKVVLTGQPYSGLVNVLEQLSHIAIVSFYKGTTV